MSFQTHSMTRPQSRIAPFISAVLLLIAILFVMPSPVSAVDVAIQLNGVTLESDVPPEISQGRTMVPIRLVAEQFGAEIEWLPETQRVHIRRLADEIVLTIGQPTAQVGGKSVELDVAPYIRNGRTMVPLRFIAETFGAEVAWRPESRTVVILRTDPLPLRAVIAEEQEEKEDEEEETEVPVLTPKPDDWFAVAEHRSDESAEVVLLEMERPEEFEAFLLPDPDRLVIDFPAPEDGVHEQLTHLGPRSQFIQQIRGGSPEEGTARIVIDLKRPVAYKISAAKNGLLVRLVPPASTGKLKVVLDAGHGGADPGAIGPNGTYEKTINLAVTLKTAQYLKQMGADVILTRSDDLSLGLYERPEVANQAGADLFVSIHQNSSVNSSRHGTEVYYHPNKPESRPLAEAVLRAVVQGTGSINQGVRQANFVVIRETYMPAILVESNYLSNASIEQKLRDPDFQDRLAKSIAQGIMGYWEDHGTSR